ncbi:MAG: hypothetical protein ACRDZU_08895 [Acidimicrobiales bacterium]
MGRQASERGVSMRLAVVLVALLVGGAIVGAIAILSGDDDDDASSADATSTTTTVPLSKDAEDLLSRLERGRSAQVHVRLASGAGALGGGTVTVDIWRDGDLVRQDVLLEGPEGRTEVSAFQLADGNVICQRAEADGPWTCQRSVSVATENGDPAGLIEAAAANLQGADVTATDEEIVGTAVRCYAIVRPDGESSLCVTEDGVPMRLGTQGQVLTATAVEREVSADVFTPPADVTDG